MVIGDVLERLARIEEKLDAHAETDLRIERALTDMIDRIEQRQDEQEKRVSLLEKMWWLYAGGVACVAFFVRWVLK